MGIVSDFMFVVIPVIIYNTYIYTELFVHRSRPPSFPSSPHIKLLAFELHSTSQNRLLPVLPGKNLSCVSGMVVFTIFKHLRHKIRMYKEYHSVCPLVGMGLSQPLSRQQVCPSPHNRGRVGHTRRGVPKPKFVALCQQTQPRSFISMFPQLFFLLSVEGRCLPC